MTWFRSKPLSKKRSNPSTDHFVVNWDDLETAEPFIKSTASQITRLQKAPTLDAQRKVWKQIKEEKKAKLNELKQKENIIKQQNHHFPVQHKLPPFFTKSTNKIKNKKKQTYACFNSSFKVKKMKPFYTHCKDKKKSKSTYRRFNHSYIDSFHVKKKKKKKLRWATPIASIYM